MMSDTRTNAGVDNISVFRKMFLWETEGERSITLMTAGNLATTQAVVSLLNERSQTGGRARRALDPRGAVDVPGRESGGRDAARGDQGPEWAMDGPEADSPFSATLILGGQVRGGEPRLFMIYPEGNFVEASHDTPFFQIGETKYGKPILVRAYDEDMSFEDAVKLLMLSFDSTIKANLSVGLPLDLHLYETDSFHHGIIRRIERDDAFFETISSGWGEALKDAFNRLPPYTIG
jgi:putative proteasome-type protease